MAAMRKSRKHKAVEAEAALVTNESEEVVTDSGEVYNVDAEWTPNPLPADELNDTYSSPSDEDMEKQIVHDEGDDVPDHNNYENEETPVVIEEAEYEVFELPDEVTPGMSTAEINEPQTADEKEWASDKWEVPVVAKPEVIKPRMLSDEEFAWDFAE